MVELPCVGLSSSPCDRRRQLMMIVWVFKGPCFIGQGHASCNTMLSPWSLSRPCGGNFFAIKCIIHMGLNRKDWSWHTYLVVTVETKARAGITAKTVPRKNEWMACVGGVPSIDQESWSMCNGGCRHGRAVVSLSLVRRCAKRIGLLRNCGTGRRDHRWDSIKMPWRPCCRPDHHQHTRHMRARSRMDCLRSISAAYGVQCSHTGVILRSSGTHDLARGRE